MEEAQDLIIAHQFNSELKEGDVSLVLRADSLPEIHHNVGSLAESGRLVGGPDGNATGVFMALALLDIMANDQAALSAAMIRVAGRIDGGTLRLVM